MKYLIFAKEGLRMFKRRLYFSEFKEYKGNDISICKQIVKDCYNKDKGFFQTSTGHFSQYWSRDFGLCVKSLKKLGYEQAISNTLDYAMTAFRRKGEISCAINPLGIAFDFPTFSPDSFAFNLYSLKVCNDKNLIKKYKDFLEQQALLYKIKVMDKRTGLVKKIHFSSIRDQSITISSTYNNVMAAWVSKTLDELKLDNPLKDFDIKSNIKEKLWKEDHFIDDLSGKNEITSYANIFPFWTGVFTNKRMLKKSINTIKKEKLDKPFPIKYSVEKPKFYWFTFFEQDYEWNSIWPHVGYPYIEIVQKVDKKLADTYLKKYSSLIKKHKNFLEVYNLLGKPFKKFYYVSDEGMLWAANHIRLKTKK